MKKIPVSVITGFLGSGKTTLLSELLNSDNMQNAAIIINEFGEIGIDNLLVKSSVENTLLLENGCVCCSIRGDLSDTIAGLFSQVKNQDIPLFDIILIETTGLAQPGPIVQTIQTDISINNRCEFDKVITVVDSVSVQQQVQLHQEPSTQIIQADIIYLSKTDIAKSELIKNAHSIITRLNPSATIINKISNLQIRETIESLHFKKNCYICDHDDHSHEHSHSHKTENHLSDYKNWSLKTKIPLDKEKFLEWLSTLYSFYPLSILRLKGFVKFEGTSQHFLMQAVGPVFSELRVVKFHDDEANTETSLIIIFKDLSSSEIESSFSKHVLNEKVFRMMG